MILDKGICSIYQTTNTAAPGDMPNETLTLVYQSWYGEINFESSPATIGAQEGVTVSNRIRILQNRIVTNHDVAVLSSTQTPLSSDPKYNVIRAYHGNDDNGQPITDLTLERLVQE